MENEKDDDDGDCDHDGGQKQPAGARPASTATPGALPLLPSGPVCLPFLISHETNLLPGYQL
jgi:hypothetical protein